MTDPRPNVIVPVDPDRLAMFMDALIFMWGHGSPLDAGDALTLAGQIAAAREQDGIGTLVLAREDAYILIRALRFYDEHVRFGGDDRPSDPAYWSAVRATTDELLAAFDR